MILIICLHKFIGLNDKSNSNRHRNIKESNFKIAKAAIKKKKVFVKMLHNLTNKRVGMANTGMRVRAVDEKLATLRNDLLMLISCANGLEV